MLEIINKNAAAIQAIAAVVSTIVTIALVIITAIYVKLTRDIAKTNQESFDEQKEANRGKNLKDY